MFTTHDRDSPHYTEFWREERTRWDRGEQDARLIELGDLVVIDSRHPTYIYIPSRADVRGLIADAGLIFVEGRLRSEVAVESEAVRMLNSECRMWVVRRPDERVSEHEEVKG